MQHRGAALLFASTLAATSGVGCAGGNELGNGGFGLGGGGAGGAAASTTKGATSSAARGSTSSSKASAASSSSSSAASSSSSSAASGGGAQGSGGAGGAGGAAATASSSTTSSGSGGGGAGPGARVVLFATSSGGSLAGAFDPGTGTWTTQTFVDASADTPGVAFGASGTACAVLHATTNDAVTFTLFDGSSWSAFLPLSSSTSITTNTAPHMASGVGTEDLVYVGTDEGLYFARRATTWTPFNEKVAGPSGTQTFVFTPPSMTETSTSVVIAFAGQDGDLFDQERVAGAWGAANAHGLGANAVAQTPAVTALSGAADLMIVYVVNPSNAQDFAAKQLMYTVHSGGSWSTPLQVDASGNAYTDDPPNLTTLPNGDALLAYRGHDGTPYFARWSTSAVTPAWSTPLPFATPNPAVTSTPAIAPGVGGVDAEAAIVDTSSGDVVHMRLTGTAFSSHALGQHGFARVAIASQ